MAWCEKFPQSSLPLSGEHLWVLRGDHKYTVKDTTHFKPVILDIPFITFDPSNDRLSLWGDLSGGKVKMEIVNDKGEIISATTSLLSEDSFLVIPLTSAGLDKFQPGERGLVNLYLVPDKGKIASLDKLRLLFSTTHGWREVFPTPS